MSDEEREALRNSAQTLKKALERVWQTQTAKVAPEPLSNASVDTLPRVVSVHRGRRSRVFDRNLHSPLHFLERAHLDLAQPLPGNAELGRKLLQRDRLLGELACLKDTPLARAEHREFARSPTKCYLDSQAAPARG
jgi:hypothetical protein